MFDGQNSHLKAVNPLYKTTNYLASILEPNKSR